MTPTMNTISNLVSFDYLLIENYKSLSLNEGDVTLILVIDHLIKQKNKFIDADALAIKMVMSKKEIDDRLSNLMTRGYVKYIKGKHGMETTLAPLKEKLINLFKTQMAEEDEFSVNETKENSLKSLILLFQTQFNRSLSPIETSLLKDWVQQGFSLETISNALQDCINKGKKSFTTIYNTMIEKEKSKDIKKEGFSARSDIWNKNIEETIEIAKAKWNSK